MLLLVEVFTAFGRILAFRGMPGRFPIPLRYGVPGTRGVRVLGRDSGDFAAICFLTPTPLVNSCVANKGVYAVQPTGDRPVTDR